MFNSNGTIRYDNESGYRLTVEVDKELSNYYYSLIPKYLKASRPRWAAHVTVVRPEKEIPINLQHWRKYENQVVEFVYDPYICFGKSYYWLNIWCPKLEDIREELGLSVYSKWTLPPEGISKKFHCTIANSKIEDGIKC